MEEHYTLPDGRFDLNEELARARSFYRNHDIPADSMAEIDQQVEELADSGILAHVPDVGDQAPGFTLPDANGTTVGLEQLLRSGPAVVSFYRGRWCPYCNIALRSLQQILPELTALDASLVAISPQTPDHTLTTAEKNALDFHVLSDSEATVAHAYAVAFRIPGYLQQIYETFGFPLPEFNGEGQQTLPIPATFVIDQDQTIRFRFISPDFTLRADPARLVSVVTEISTAAEARSSKSASSPA
jgi:peroxiredoxin